MEIYITDQLKACLAFVVLGTLTGFVYDTLRTIRCFFTARNWRGSKAFGFISDLLIDLVFMIALAISVVLLTYCYSYGKLRFFDVISFSAALFLYKLTLGRLYRVTVIPLTQKLRIIVLRLVAMTIRPVIFVLSLTNSFAKWVFASSLGRLIQKIRSARIEAKFSEMLDCLDSDVIF